MIREEAQEHYPGCPDAVILHEQPVFDHSWSLARTNHSSPGKIVRKMRDSLTAMVASGYGSLEAALGQLDHPDFLRYVAAKLGAL